MIMRRIVRALLVVVGMIAGFELIRFGLPVLAELEGTQYSDTVKIAGIVAGTLFFGFIGYIIAPFVTVKIRQTLTWVEGRLQNISALEMSLSVVGLIIGLVIAALLTFPFVSLPVVGPFLPVFAALVFGYLGIHIARVRKEDWQHLLESFPKLKGAAKSAGKQSTRSLNKILDTSVIIDGRIADICKTGFIEGTLVVPQFVLEELQKIADSSDMLKRARGRRGLDTMNYIQGELKFPLTIIEQDFPEITEVDSKLVKLARNIGGKVLTNDYNLNKVAELHGVEVLNINELANAIKPVVIPGEEMNVFVVKEGKEHNQGVAYLDDGTMVVVENGKKLIGVNLRVFVTSVLQTAAGRMIFARPADENH